MTYIRHFSNLQSFLNNYKMLLMFSVPPPEQVGQQQRTDKKKRHWNQNGWCGVHQTAEGQWVGCKLRDQDCVSHTMVQEWKTDVRTGLQVDGFSSGGGDTVKGGLSYKKLDIFTFSASSLTSRVPRLDGLSTRKRLSRFSQSVDM